MPEVDPEPTPTPPSEPTGFISLVVIGPPSSCERSAGAGGLRIPISAQGPTDLPDVLTELNTRLEVATGTYTISPGVFDCEGIRYAPVASPVVVTIQRVITGYAFLYYQAVASVEPPGQGTDAASVLSRLAVSAEVRAGYSRELFRHWIDADGDGCNTRQEVLIEESTMPAQIASGCRITSGNWVSAYDGVRTQDLATFDIDHMVPLAEAWDSGARLWDARTRQDFANDLGFDGSLIAVSASSNRSKGDRDPAEWLPPNANYRCTYVITWIAVKYRWSLSVDPVERSTLRDNVIACGNPTMALPSKAAINAAVGS